MRVVGERRVMKAGRRAPIVLAGCAVMIFLCVNLITVLTPRGQSYLQGQEPRTTLRVLRGLTAIVFLSFVPIGAHMFWLGRRAVRSRQMPPPGTWLIRDTRVVEGRRAVMWGRSLMALAVIGFAVCVFSSIWLPYKSGRAFAQRAHEQTHEASESAVEATPPANDITP